jgi:polo-like kinase 1
MSEPPRPKTPGEALETVTERVTKSSGEVVVRRYTKGRLLGKGGFSRVYELTSQESKRAFAGKVICKSALTKARAKQKLMSEIKIHRSLTHSNIVAFSHFFEDQENVYLLIELCTNQTLSELVRRRKRLTEVEVQCYGMQIVEGLQYLHQHNVIHRDLKLGNLFLSERMELKLGDFGLAAKVEYDGERKRTICGTPNYIAPEVLDGKSGHSFEVDIWSLGVVLYTLLVGKPPFETSDVRTTYKRIKMNAYSFPEHLPLSSTAKSLITRILNSDPEKRPTLEDIRSHEFFCPGYTIPKTLPPSTLAVPPCKNYLEQQCGIVAATERKQGHGDSGPVSSRLELRLLASAPHTARTSTQRSLTPVLRCDTAPRADTSPMRSESPMLDTRKKPSVPTVEILISKWIDYSSKYGLAYLLSNGCTGVYFNDSSKIVLNPTSGVLEYVDRKNITDIPTRHTLKNYPEDLRKKITLLQHFSSQLLKDSSQALVCTAESPLMYVKRYMAVGDVMTFRLSNRSVQVTYGDGCKLLIESGSKTVVVVEGGSRVTYPLAYAVDAQEESLHRRMRIAKEAISKLMPVPDGRQTLRESNR